MPSAHSFSFQKQDRCTYMRAVHCQNGEQVSITVLILVFQLVCRCPPGSWNGCARQRSIGLANYVSVPSTERMQLGRPRPALFGAPRPFTKTVYGSRSSAETERAERRGPLSFSLCGPIEGMTDCNPDEPCDFITVSSKAKGWRCHFKRSEKALASALAMYQQRFRPECTKVNRISC